MSVDKKLIGSAKESLPGTGKCRSDLAEAMIVSIKQPLLVLDEGYAEKIIDQAAKS